MGRKLESLDRASKYLRVYGLRPLGSRHGAAWRYRDELSGEAEGSGVIQPRPYPTLTRASIMARDHMQNKKRIDIIRELFYRTCPGNRQVKLLRA